MREAVGAGAKIQAFTRMQAWRNPKIAAVARGLDAARHRDPAAAAAWEDRAANRMRGAVCIVEALRTEGQLDPAWTIEDAATLLSELTSFRVWDDLVNDAHMPPERYVEIITSAAIAALAASPGISAGRGP
jgi:hypothetical protein